MLFLLHLLGPCSGSDTAIWFHVPFHVQKYLMSDKLFVLNICKKRIFVYFSSSILSSSVWLSLRRSCLWEHFLPAPSPLPSSPSIWSFLVPWLTVMVIDIDSTRNSQVSDMNLEHVMDFSLQKVYIQKCKITLFVWIFYFLIDQEMQKSFGVKFLNWKEG